FQLAVLAEKRVAAFERTKLSFTRHLPGAAVVIADAPGTGIKHGLLDRVDVTVRNVDAQFVAWHRGSPALITLRELSCWRTPPAGARCPRLPPSPRHPPAPALR